MKPLKHQLIYSAKAWNILKEVGYVYIAALPRAGKTLTAILTAENSSKINSVLVLTKKAAISGWTKFIDDKELELKHTYTVTNYEQAHKLNSADYQLVIIDESHNLGGVGKATKRYQTIRKLCWNMPHIHLSGTAIVESQNSIYYQMSISKYNPFKYKSFYEFFRQFGKPYYLKFGGREVAQYDKSQDTLLPIINEFTVYFTQADAGISSDVQAVDKLHYIELDGKTKEIYNTIVKDKIATVCEPHSVDLVCDTVMKERVTLHMLESGVAKVDDKYIDLGNNEKIDYILHTFGDTKDVGIMSHFIAERNKLEKVFQKAQIYSSTANAEGVDLSHLTHFIILSSDYSGAKFIQRRDRIVNVNGSASTIVNFILVKGAISEQVYLKTSKKLDFNNSTYKRTTL